MNKNSDQTLKTQYTAQLPADRSSDKEAITPLPRVQHTVSITKASFPSADMTSPDHFQNRSTEPNVPSGQENIQGRCFRCTSAIPQMKSLKSPSVPHIFTPQYTEQQEQISR